MNLKSIFSKKNNNQAIVSQLLIEMEAIRYTTSVLVLVPGTTDYSWMGVNRATISLFPSQSIVLPQYYSHSIFSEKEQEQLIQKILQLNFEQVIFSGFPTYFDNLNTNNF